MADFRVDKAITLTLHLRGHRHYCPRQYAAMRAACLAFVSGGGVQQRQPAGRQAEDDGGLTAYAQG